MAILTTYALNSTDAWYNRRGCFPLDVPFYYRTGRLRSTGPIYPDADALFTAQDTDNLLLAPCYVEPLDQLTAERVMIACGYTSGMDCADWIGRLEAAGDTRTLPNLRRAFPAYFAMS